MSFKPEWDPPTQFLRRGLAHIDVHTEEWIAHTQTQAHTIHLFGVGKEHLKKVAAILIGTQPNNKY